MNKMTSYDRVKAALEHREADKVPFDLGSAAVTGINVQALFSLRKYLGLPENVTVKDRITQIANTHDFFMLFVVMSGVAALILLSLSNRLQKMLHMNAE